MAQAHVLVVGGGPTGFVTALGLVRRGMRVTLIEAQPEIVDSPRAIVYHWSVLDGLEALGILEDAIARGFTKQDYSNTVFRTKEKISWSLAPLASITKHPYNLHLGQNELAEIARDHLARHSDATVRFGTKITGLEQDSRGVIVTLEGPEGAVNERYDWVIGADGAASTVREKLLKLNFFGITWPERFIATNVRYDFAAHGYASANMVLDDEWGAIIAKIDTRDLWRVTVMEDANLPLEGIEERIHTFYDAYVPGIEGYDIVQYSPYRMHQRCADSMRVGRVLLAGDSAHITNPTGGLGLTAGLFDSYFLVDVLSAVVNDGAPEDLLDRYSNERRRIFIELVSPQASRNKMRCYHGYASRWFEGELANLRRLQESPDAVIAMAGFTKSLQSTL